MNAHDYINTVTVNCYCQ